MYIGDFTGYDSKEQFRDAFSADLGVGFLDITGDCFRN